MKVISPSIKKLLDRLYNLRGADSSILAKMTSDKNEAEDVHQKACTLKEEIENIIHDLSNKLKILDTRGTKLKEIFKNLEEEDFSDVLKLIDLDFDLKAMSECIDTSLPESESKIQKELAVKNDELANAEKAIEEALTNISELEIRIAEAAKDQEKLNTYLNMALESNMNITRDEITALLERLEFTADEQKEIAKLLMFPEDGLFAYNENPNQILNEVETIQKEEIVENKEEVSLENTEEDPSGDEVLDVNMQLPEKEPVIEQEVITKETLVELLNSLDFDYLDFTANDFNNMLNNFNRELFIKNVDLLKKEGISKDIFLDNISLFYDEELENKVNKLISIGKSSQDIYLNPEILVKYNMSDLENAIHILENSGLDPKNVPLMAY